MLRGIYKLKLSNQQKKNIGFRYNPKADIYTYRFPVYKHKNITLLYCEISTDEDDTVWFNVINNDGTLYPSYYNCQYGKSDVTKIVDENILKEFEKIGVKKE